MGSFSRLLAGNPIGLCSTKSRDIPIYLIPFAGVLFARLMQLLAKGQCTTQALIRHDLAITSLEW
jgi:hypothetical protein